MDLIEKLKDDLKNALKAGEKIRVSTLRLLLNSLYYQPGNTLSLLQKEVKKREEAIAAFRKGNRQDLVDQETAELKIIQSYLPKMMSEEEIKDQISKIKKTRKNLNFGEMMKAMMPELKGKAEGALVAKIVREELQS